MRATLLLLIGLAGCVEPDPATVPAVSADPILAEPVGDVPIAPPRFVFPESPGVATYRLTVRDPAGRQVATVSGSGSPLILPAQVADYFIRGETYEWRVELVDERGRRVGEQQPRTFVIRPH